MSSFDPQAIETFHFVDYQFAANGEVAFYYALDDHQFCERYRFPPPSLPLTLAQQQALTQILRYVHLMVGISYFKAAVPPKIQVHTGPLDKVTAAFFQFIYQHGLGEFAVVNQLDLRERIHFPYTSGVSATPVALELPRRTLVPVGGGKDSCVTLEMLNWAEEPMISFTLGEHQATQACAQVAGTQHICVQRTLDPYLFELNRQGAYNGHVPISAIIAFLLPVAGVLYGCDMAALSNERSASVGNLYQHGIEVNHQFSKGFAFEQAVAHFIRDHMVSTFSYFSLLRPLSELHIAQLFAQRCQAYHAVFTSCNRAFRIQAAQDQAWCGQCPKCQFVYLILAPFMPRQQLQQIFGHELLLDPAQVSGFRQLLGLEAHKPFECVGEIQESQAALGRLAQHPDWQNEPGLAAWLAELPEAAQLAQQWQQALAPSTHHAIPPSLHSVLDDYLQLS